MKIDKIFLLFIPWLISLALFFTPGLSYVVAWIGSFWIFYVTLSGKISPLPNDLPIAGQLMRPIFLTQIIFAGYMACTSIFYFLQVLGYSNFESPSPFFAVDENELALVAECQRYYCLGHACFVTGIFAIMNYNKPAKYVLTVRDKATFFLAIALVTLPLSTSFLIIPGLRQFYFQFNSLSFIAGTVALAYAIPLKKVGNTIVCSFLYFSNFTQSLLSGYKEPIIISILVLGIYLYPHYKRTIILTFIPIILGLFIILPAYNQAFRSKAWAGEESARDASNAAIDELLNDEEFIEDNTTWGFLTGRLSEIQMFTTYVKTTPFPNNFYGSEILQQAIIVIVPRIFWPQKPVTEDLVMQRVYNAGVAVQGSTVSAKPQLVVDGYLSAGTIGVFLTLIVYGIICQFISQFAEHLFGGYELGTALIYSGLFQILWRGLSFEFLINSVFWSFFSMMVIFQVLKMFRYIKPVAQDTFKPIFDVSGK